MKHVKKQHIDLFFPGDWRQRLRVNVNYQLTNSIARPLTIFIIFLLTVSAVGCGNATAIKSYRFSTTKYNLENAVMKVIKGNPNIYRDSSRDGTLDSLMQVAMKEHSVVDSAVYYNDGKAYITLKIRNGQTDIDYVCRYYGEEEDWKKSPDSKIFIVAVQDKYGTRLTQGHNENGQFEGETARKFLELFETEFISKIDQILHLKHSEE